MSTLVALGVGALWAASYHASHSAVVTRFTAHPGFERRNAWYAVSSQGGLKLWFAADNYAIGSAGRHRPFSLSTSKAGVYPFFGTRSTIPGRDRLTLLQRRGFEVRDHATDERPNPPHVTRGVIVPHWFVVLPSLVLPALWLRRQVRTAREVRRQAAGLCRGCGYDLTGNQSGACPECGATVQLGVAE